MFTFFTLLHRQMSKTTIETWKKALHFLRNKFRDFGSNELFNSVFQGKLKYLCFFYSQGWEKNSFCFWGEDSFLMNNVKIFIISHSLSPPIINMCSFALLKVLIFMSGVYACEYLGKLTSYKSLRYV